MSANKLPNDLIRTAFKACYHLGQLTKEMREVDAQIVSDQFGKENSADHCIDSIMFRDPAVEVLSEEAFHLYAKLCDGTLMVCCRETANFGDWLSNLKVCADISLEGRIHAGFWKKALSIPLYPLLQHLRSGKRVLFTGFSQGSAVAELVMIRLLNHIGFDIKWALQRKIIFIGFGCPLIGDDAFCKSIHSVNGPGNVPLYKDLFFHIVNKNDVVPRLTSVLSLASKSVQKLMTALLSFADATVAGKVLSEVAREAYQLLVPEYRPLGSWLFSQEHSGMTTWATYDTFDKTGMEAVIRLLTYKPEADQIKGEHFQQHRPTGYLQSLMSLEFPTERFKLRDVPCTPVFDEKVTASARWIAGYYFVQVRGSLVLYASQVKLENHPVDDITSQSKYSDIGDTLVLQVKCDKPVEKLTIVLELPYLIFGARTRTIPCECLVTQDLTDINRMPFIAILRCALFHALLAPTSAAGKTAINCLNDLDKRYNLSGSEQELNELNKDEMAVCACLVSWVMQTGTKIPDSDRIWDNPKAFLEPSSLSTTAKLLFSKLVSFNAANNDKDALNQLKMFIDKRRQPDNALSFREYFRRLDQQFQTQLNLSQLPPLISHNMLFSKFTEKSEVPNPSITAFFSAAAPIQNLIVLKMMHSPKLSMVKKNDYSFWDRVGKFFSAPLKLFNTDLYPEKSLIKADKSYGKRLIALYSMLYPQEAKNLNFFSETFDFFKLEGDIARLSTAEIQAKLRTSFKGINEKMVGEERKICENFCHVVKNIYQLREICKNERFIAVAGMQNAGKSRLLKDLWGMKTESSLIINTREPSAYLFQFGQEIVSNIKAIDLPAITDSNVLTTAMQTMILPCTLAACIILDIKNAQDAVCLDLLSEMEKQMKFPFIVLLNQADLLLNNILEEEKPTVDEDPFAPDDSDATQKNENRKSVFDSRVNQIIFEIITQVPSLVGRIYPTCLYPSGREELKKHQYLSECDMKNDPLVQPKPENAQLVIYGKCGVRHLLDYHFRELAIKQVKPEIWGKLIVGPNLTKYNQYHASKSTQ